MVSDILLVNMSRYIRAMITVFTVLNVHGRLTHSAPAPFNVSVKCDSYGVVVDWMSTGLSEQADFLLDLTPDFGENVSVTTKYPPYNISDLLLDTAYNHYFVKVKARDGKDGDESEFAESQTFAFNCRKTVNIICGLEFPAVGLFPRHGQLFVHFINPLHLYRDSPALRNIGNNNFHYTVTSGKIYEEFTCSFETDECESNVSFPEEQEQYCVTLSGRIRQTCVWETKPYCHQGTLNTGLSSTVVCLLWVLGGVAAMLSLAFFVVFVWKFVSKNIKKRNLAKYPEFLGNMLRHNPLTTPLNMEPEPVAANPRLEPTFQINLQESTTLLETSPNSDNLTDLTDDQDVTNFSGRSGTGAGFPQEEEMSAYGNGADLSSTDLSTGYDRPHTLLEMSPGDMVKTYDS